jgi:Flp pilus assembly protein TadD
LAKVYAARQQWNDAAEQCRETLRLNIASWETRTLLVKSLLRLGEKTKAQKEFENLLDFEPPEAEDLRRWFAEENR